MILGSRKPGRLISGWLRKNKERGYKANLEYSEELYQRRARTGLARIYVVAGLRGSSIGGAVHQRSREAQHHFERRKREAQPLGSGGHHRQKLNRLVSRCKWITRW